MGEALSLVKQERRFYLTKRKLSKTVTDYSALDTAIIQEQVNIQNESLRLNELGLFRNAALILGSMASVWDDPSVALDHFLDVAFLDMNGATNSHPGGSSYNRDFADLLPYTIAIIRNEIGALSTDAVSTRERFAAKWIRFAAYGAPPYGERHCWSKLKKEIFR